MLQGCEEGWCYRSVRRDVTNDVRRDDVTRM